MSLIYHSPISSPYIHDRKGLYLMNHRTGQDARSVKIKKNGTQTKFKIRRCKSRGAAGGFLGEKPVDKPKKMMILCFFYAVKPVEIIYIYVYICSYIYIYTILILFFEWCLMGAGLFLLVQEHRR
jgi:hypothetical protein